MNLYQRLKPEVLVLVNKYAEKYPTTGGELVEALENNVYLHDLRYGHVVELEGIVPWTPDQTPYDLFLEA